MEAKTALMQTLEVKTIIVGDRKVDLYGDPKKVTKKMYGWSKWGGVNFGLVQENKTEEWSCQGCGNPQASELPSYMFEFSPDEFIRICSICQAIKFAQHITSLDGLIQAVRAKRTDWNE